MPNYVLPQVLVFQEFATVPAAALQPLLACIVGEQFSLHRYSDATEKAGILVTSNYDPAHENCYLWPDRPAGGIVDQSYTRVFIDNALLQYFHNAASLASPIYAVGPAKNRIRASAKIFASGNGFVRDVSLLRDVLPGDSIKILASVCDGDPVVYKSSVVGLVADTLAAIVSPATSDVGNTGVLIASTSHSQIAGKHNDVEILSVNGASYDGLADGNPIEAYTVEVIGASVGGNATTALLKVTSASGNDDQAVVTPAAFGSPTSIGTRGLTATWTTGGSSSSGGTPVPPTDFLIGQKFIIHVTQAFTPPVEASGGVYVGPSDTTYVVTVTTGGKFSGGAPKITVSTTTGIDLSGPTPVTTSAVFVPAGTQGVLIKFTGTELNKGDRYYIPVAATKPGAIRTLVLANTLPPGIRGFCSIVPDTSSSSSSGADPLLDVTLYIKKNIEVTENRLGFAPLVNWTQTQGEICIEDNIVSYDSSWEIGGVPQPLPVEDGAVYVQHRDRISDHCSIVGTITDVSAVPLALGTVDPDNPLAFGVFKALSNSGGQPVKYLGVCGAASGLVLNDWLTALNILVGRDDVYGLVPLTQNEAVLQAFQAHCDDQSSPENGRWRICWLNMAAQQPIPVYVTQIGNTNPLLATIVQDPDEPPPAYVDVESGGAEFITKGVKSGDTVRALYTSDGFGNLSYTEFTVDLVINQDTIRLLAGPAAPVNVPSKIEIWRTLSPDALAANLATYPGIFSDRRAYLVWPDVVGDAGQTFPGYFLCAALSGLRSGVLPQQGLTNISVSGFDDLSRTTVLFSATQLNTMAASGYWIVTQDPNDGTVFTRHQLSTGSQADLNTKEQSITTNLDSISYLFLNRMKPFIGQGNVTPTMINILQGEILAVIAQLSNTITIDRLGPQIITAKILDLAPSPTLLDRIVAHISVTLPFPLNNLELHLIA